MVKNMIPIRRTDIFLEEEENRKNIAWAKHHGCCEFAHCSCCNEMIKRETCRFVHKLSNIDNEDRPVCAHCDIEILCSDNIYEYMESNHPERLIPDFHPDFEDTIDYYNIMMLFKDNNHEHGYITTEEIEDILFTRYKSRKTIHYLCYDIKDNVMYDIKEFMRLIVGCPLYFVLGIIAKKHINKRQKITKKITKKISPQISKKISYRKQRRRRRNRRRKNR